MTAQPTAYETWGDQKIVLGTKLTAPPLRPEHIARERHPAIDASRDRTNPADGCSGVRGASGRPHFRAASSAAKIGHSPEREIPDPLWTQGRILPGLIRESDRRGGVTNVECPGNGF